LRYALGFKVVGVDGLFIHIKQKL